MIFGGVFERHPNLKVMYTEQNGDWWRSTMAEFDSLHHSLKALRKAAPKPPSEYCAQSVGDFNRWSQRSGRRGGAWFVG
jgi:hypothetical protein